VEAAARARARGRSTLETWAEACCNVFTTLVIASAVVTPIAGAVEQLLVEP
jgi:hypothetical protein